MSLLFFTITSSYNTQFSLTLNDLTLLKAIFITIYAPMTTYLKDLTQSIGRYGGHSKQDLGLRVLDAQVVSLLSSEFLSSKHRGKHHMLKDL